MKRLAAILALCSLAIPATASTVYVRDGKIIAPGGVAPAYSTTATPPVTDTNLIALYTFTTGAGQLNDSSSYSNHLANPGGSSSPTFENNYVKFDGAGDYLIEALTGGVALALQGGALTGTTKTWTVNFWMNNTNATANRGFFGLLPDLNNRIYSWNISQQSPWRERIEMKNDNDVNWTTWSHAINVVTSGVWHMETWVYDMTPTANSKHYINGILVEKDETYWNPATSFRPLTASATSTQTNALYLGVYYSSSYTFLGLMDDFSLYKSAKTSNEVYSLYLQNRTSP